MDEMTISSGQPETSNDVISGMFVRQFIADKVVKFGDSKSNRS